MIPYEYRLIYQDPESGVYREAYFYTRVDLDSFISKLNLITYSIHRC